MTIDERLDRLTERHEALAESMELQSHEIETMRVTMREALYTRFIKTFPCCACRAWWRIDPCHTGPHSHGAKGCDLRVIPLCRKCHEAFDASPFKFASKYRLDIEQLITTYRELYVLNYPERFTKPEPIEGEEAA